MIRSPFADVAIPDISLYDSLFADLSEEELERIAIIDGVSGAETSYRSLRSQIDAVAGALASLGAKPGDVVGLLCPNIPAFAAVFHGALGRG